MPHHDYGRGVETLDEQAAFLVDGKVERPTNAGHAPLAQPGLCCLEERLKDLRVILRLEQAEKARPIVVALQMKLVHLCADTSHGLASAPGDPGLESRVQEIGIVPGQVLFALEKQGRNPGGIMRIERVGKMQESAKLILAAHWQDFERGVGRKGYLFGCCRFFGPDGHGDLRTFPYELYLPQDFRLSAGSSALLLSLSKRFCKA